MSMFATAGRIATSVAAMAATRLELAAVEVQEEARRLLGYFAWTLLAVGLAAGAVLLAALFVILLFWDSYRLQAVAAMAGLLGVAALLVLGKVRSALAAKPALLTATLTELRKDLALIHIVASERADAAESAQFAPPGSVPEAAHE